MNSPIPSQPGTTETESRWAIPPYLTSEPVLVAILSVLAVVLFLFVGGLSKMYHAQQNSLGDRWFTRGIADLNAQNFDAAMLEFRTALRYSRDNYDYQLNLAKSLIGLRRTAEARSYLVNLWERRPENGEVNLALARIAAQNNQSDQAQRYYHNAIYATWPADEQTQRRETRVELIEYLLKNKANEQAQSELIALAANLGDDPAQQERVGELFLRAQDYEHALAAFRLALKSGHGNESARAGAGRAAFQLGQYPIALKYLQTAVAEKATDTQSAALLRTTELVMQMDPFQRDISAAHRNRIVVTAFATAGERLKACGMLPASNPGAASSSNLASAWQEMKPRITERNLQRDPDLVESAMDLAFEVERDSATGCGTPSAADQALLLISKSHEGH